MKEENFEVRDLRNGDWYWVERAILQYKKFNASDKLVYHALAYFVNQKQKCRPSTRTIMELTGLTQPTVLKSLKKLEEAKAISILRRSGKVSLYTLLKTKHLKNLSTKKENKTTKKERVGPLKKKGTNNNKEQKLNNNISKADEFSFSTYLKEMKEKARHIQIIALYWEFKKYKFDNVEQARMELRRNLKAAKDLVGYDDDDIIETMKALQKTEWLHKWTLETVGKFINDIMAAKRNKEPEPVRYEEVKMPDGKIVMRAIYKK
ncbi:MAG: helix-turn-helix domain-containing protein [Candidatus Hodarchaeales archaeon]